MNKFSGFGAALLAAALCMIAGSAFSAEEMQTWDGLTKVKGKRLDAVYLLPNADFSGYNSVLLLPVVVAVHKNWQRDMNDKTRSTGRKITPEEITQLREEVAKNVLEIFSEELKKGGYTLATAPGPNTLSLQVVIADLYINAPEKLQEGAGRSKSYTFEAGYATLALETRDAATNQLLGRAVDRREARTSGSLQWTTSVSNRADFRNMFRTWAKILVKGMDDLKERKPTAPSPSAEAKAAA
jgi:Protein of unknown function (DUF3313)